MYFEVAQTIAEVAGALTGFVGIVFILGNRAGRKLSARERSGLRHLLIGSVGTLLLAVLSMVLVTALDPALAWRISASVIASIQ